MALSLTFLSFAFVVGVFCCKIMSFYLSKSVVYLYLYLFLW